MGSLVAFEWVSVDGVFDSKHMEDWFFPYDSPARRTFIKTTYEWADAFLMGRTTHEMLSPYWATLPDDAQDGLAGVLTHTPKYVTMREPVTTQWGVTVPLQGDAGAEVKELKRSVGNLMLIGSGMLAESLAKDGLIDEYKLFVQPFVMGVGRQLFGAGMKTPLELVEARELDQGTLLLHYRVKK